MALQSLLYEPKRGLSVAGLGDIALQDLALLVDCPPQVMQLSIDLLVNLVEVPLPLVETSHPAHTLVPHIGCEQRFKPVSPVPHGLMADFDLTPGKQVLDVPQRKRTTTR